MTVSLRLLLRGVAVVVVLAVVAYWYLPLDWKHRRAAQHALAQGLASLDLAALEQPRLTPPVETGECAQRLSKIRWTYRYGIALLPPVPLEDWTSRVDALQADLRRDGYEMTREGGDLVAAKGDELVLIARYHPDDQGSLAVIAGACATSAAQLPERPALPLTVRAAEPIGRPAPPARLR